MSIQSLPPEIFLSYVIPYLPLESIANLALSSRHFAFLNFHSLEIEPSAIPWRRRFFAHKRAHKLPYLESENRAFDAQYSNSNAGNGVSSSIVSGTQVMNKTTSEQKYEALLVILLKELGLLPPESSTGAVQRFPLLSEYAVFEALDAIFLPDARAKGLWLPALNCTPSRVIESLETNMPLDLVKCWLPADTVLVDKKSTGPGNERATLYKIIAAYLLYTDVEPRDVMDILTNDVADHQELENAELDNGKALTEFYCFLALLLDVWDAQVDMLRDVPAITPSPHGGSSEPDFVFWRQTRRILKGRLQRWIWNYFRAERPLPPPTAPRSGTHGKRSLTFGSSCPIPKRQKAGPSRSLSSSLPSMVALSIESQPNPIALTPEQQKIIDMKVKPGDLVKVMAFAGTGKTSVLMRYAKEYTEQFLGTKVLYVAFNQSARTDAIKVKSEIGADNVDCKTFHSCCYGAVGVVAPHLKYTLQSKLKGFFSSSDIIKVLKLDDKKIKAALVNPERHAPLRTKKQNLNGRKPFPSATSIAIRVKNAFDRYCNSAEIEINQRCLPAKHLDELGLKHSDVLGWVKRLWWGMVDPNSTDELMTHDCYSKLVYLAGYNARDGRRSPGDEAAFGNYDVILYDEAQDSNECMSALILRQRPFVGMMIVGDQYQKIYGFRGATNECFDDEKYPPTHKFYLTHSFRFGDEIAQVANVLLRALREKMSIHGVRKDDSVRRSVAAHCEWGDSNYWRVRILEPHESGKYTVVFRKNISLVQYAIAYVTTHPNHTIAMRVNTNFEKKSLFDTLRHAYELYHHDTPAKFGALKGWTTWQELKDHVQAGESDTAINETPMLTLVVAMEETLKDPDFLDKISQCENNVIDPEHHEQANVTLITAHQAKGLQWDRVVVASDFKVPFEMRSKLGRVKYWREEMHMLYVAVTRARRELLVTEPVTSWLAAELGVTRHFVTKRRPEDINCSKNHWELDVDELRPGLFEAAQNCAVVAKRVYSSGSFGVDLTDPNTGESVLSHGGPADETPLCCLICAVYRHGKVPPMHNLKENVGPLGYLICAAAERMRRRVNGGDDKDPIEKSRTALYERIGWREGYQNVVENETAIVQFWTEPALQSTM